MKQMYILILFFFSTFYLKGQEYEVNIFEKQYVPLESYKSIVIEQEGEIFWEKEFELPFSFPYFDQEYYRILCNSSSICYFDEYDEFIIKLLSFSYLSDILTDTFDIQSDSRYSYQQIDGEDLLIIERLKNRLATDDSVEEHDSHITFQTLFYQDGTIEIHIGDYNLEHSANYIEGEGFFLDFDGTLIPTGPEMYLEHADDPTRSVSVSGNYDSYEVLENTGNSGRLSLLPPPNWVIQFKPKSPMSVSEQNDVKKVTIFNNPVHDELFISDSYRGSTLVIYDLAGNARVNQIVEDNTLNLSGLSPGMYIVRMQHQGTNYIQKISKL